ncbi:hypothetical protein chiPu_0024089 [Chiloscyllium punctatum]|uniref:Uncharacterized protein n=1 Tax=Chiloscyllium punctatum TaxID=137246 RepID=A0A401TBP2_CHIPU|nr:hypothetical protein [Chiloscyllium punctatum]
MGPDVACSLGVVRPGDWARCILESRPSAENCSASGENLVQSSECAQCSLECGPCEVSGLGPGWAGAWAECSLYTGSRVAWRLGQERPGARRGLETRSGVVWKLCEVQTGD